MDNGKYLDPKADLTFKKVFGEHEDLVMSLLNALLPLDEGKQIEHVEYMSPELVPENPGKKNSIVDVCCRETGGRQFIVEMQMNWNHEFEQRVILNASKAVIKQLKTNEDYRLLQPVYALNLINDVGFQSGPDEFYHDYAIVNVAHTDRIIEGLRFVFVELPKFKPQTIKERKMAVLWLRFLTEINKGTREAPKELLENPETGKALKILEKSAYTEGELYAYERYWDYVNYERGIVEGGYYKGKAEAEAKAQAKIEEAEAQVKEAEARMEQQKLDTARRMKGKGFDVEDIAEITGLTAEEVASL